MKKIFAVLVLALSMSLVCTGCASKKANAPKGPKTYRIDLGSAMGTIEIGKEEKVINVTSLLPDGAAPSAGEIVRVMWSAVSDADIGKIYISCGDNSDDFVLIEDVEENKPFYAAVSIPLDLDVAGPLYVNIWSDTEAVCELAYIDAK